jgi:pseudouridine-5'-phosphate glycosidase
MFQKITLQCQYAYDHRNPLLPINAFKQPTRIFQARDKRLIIGQSGFFRRGYHTSHFAAVLPDDLHYSLHGNFNSEGIIMHSSAVQVSAEVRDALASGRPVVALESTIIAHGMPYPTNVETALACEQIVRDAGAVPATLAIIDGQIRAGLTRDEITFMGTDSTILKAVERDIPVVVAQKRHAATTAGCSLAIAAAAGIRVFVTGGIGGVGPLAADDFDISADLLAIADYPCLTVCSGAKAFMDIPATLEFLESHRVPVLSYGSDEFPLFYSRHSGCKVEWAVHTPAEVAAILHAKVSLDMSGGILLGVPVPSEHELPAADARAAIDSALTQIRAAGITGKAVTPFLLSAIKDVTGSRSLDANIALIRNNARVGAEIAVAYAALG